MLKKIKFLSLVVMLFAAFAMNAQVTTSAMSGLVTDENNETMMVVSPSKVCVLVALTVWKCHT